MIKSFMVKKRSKGVLLFGLYLILSGLLTCLFGIIFITRTVKSGLGVLEEPSFFLFIILGLFVFAVGYNILKLKRLWRDIALYYHAVMILFNIGSFILSGIHFLSEYLFMFVSIVYFSLFIFYFTRPNVKAQFD